MPLLIEMSVDPQSCSSKALLSALTKVANYLLRLAEARISCISSALVTLTAMLSSSLANATIGDTFRPYAEASYGYEDNLLRLSPLQLSGSNGADSYRRFDVGMLLDKSLGRQHVSGNVKLSRTTFEKFTGLDNDAKDARATWNWQLGNYLDGTLGTQYLQGLAPFSEFRTSLRNIKTQKNTFTDAKWHFAPSWRFYAAASQQSVGYELLSQQIGNRHEDTQELGIDYLPATSSSLGVVFRRTRDNYPVQQQLGTLIVGNSYRQSEYKLKADWAVSGKSRLQFLGGFVQRDYDSFQSRNKNAPNVRISGTWQPTGKINVAVSAFHEISPSDDLSVNYSINNGISASSTWDISSKVRLEALLRRENRDYNSAATLLATFPGNRQEDYRFVSSQMTYTPREGLQLTANVFRDTLNSTFSLRSYRAEGIVVGLRAVF